MIPHLLHQIYIGQIPDREKAWCEEMRKMNAKTWDYTLHGDELFEEFKDDPYVRHLRDRGAKAAFIVDRLRVLVLAKHGGVYLDTDSQPIRPLDTLKVWDWPQITFVYGWRNPNRPGVSLSRGVSFADNSFLASAPNSRMVNLLLQLWTPQNLEVNGNMTGKCCLINQGEDSFPYGFLEFYDMQVTPRTIVLHDSHNAGTWVEKHTKLPVVKTGETVILHP